MTGGHGIGSVVVADAVMPPATANGGAPAAPWCYQRAMAGDTARIEQEVVDDLPGRQGERVRSTADVGEQLAERVPG